ncbi:MAG: hypothetical protein QOI74_3893, partial [Micromonosporaceae bacterium]|jgi:hypothetical protein|nr:hypothetical protein [Micromonosporaceae bacterium]
VTVSSVTPAAGSAQGFTQITVTGTNFPTAAGSIAASIGGLPLTGIVPVSATTFTAVTPPHSASATPVPLSVVTAGGTTVSLGAYTYSNGITVSPNTGTNGRPNATPIDVLGLGFSGLTLNRTDTNGSTPDNAKAHVYLARGAYDPAASNGAKTAGQSTECLSVLVVSDVELVCTLYLGGNGAIARLKRTFADGTIVSSKTVTSATAQFVAGDVGTAIVGAGIPAAATIASVDSPTSITLSAPATIAAAGGVALTIDPKVITDGVTTAASTAVSSASTPFTAADSGLTISGPGIQAGTTFTELTSSTGTLSKAATASSTAVPMAIGGRVVTDGVTNTGNVLVSATAKFTAGDVGMPIVGAVPFPAAATTIVSVTSPTMAVLSLPSSTPLVLSSISTATISASRVTSGDGHTMVGDTDVTSATAAFTASDVGRAISGTNIPNATTIKSVTSPTAAVMSAEATLTATTTVFTIAAPRTVADGTTVPGTTVTTSANFFAATDVGKTISGGTIPAGATIVSFTDAKNVVLSAPPTAAVAGTVTFTVGARTVADGVTAIGTTVTSASAAFTAVDAGKPISGGTIPAGATISTINSLTSVVISAPATAVGTAVALTIGPKVATDGTTIVPTYTSATAVFTSADVGRPIYGPLIPAGTTVVAQSGGTIATLSAAPLVGGPTAVATIGNPTLVPIGTYTVTVVSDGMVDADSDVDYSQSIISSGSTFTVSDY